MTPPVANASEFDLGLMTMAPLALIVVAGLIARRWWQRQQGTD